MKIRSKRFLSAIVAGATLLSVGLTGCSNKSAKKDDIYTIDYYTVCNEQPANLEPVQNKINEYLENKIGAHINMHYLTWTQYEEKMNVIIAGGEKSDIVWASGDTYRLNATKDAYLPIDELLDEYAPKAKEIVGEDFLKGAMVKGKLYGLPANKDKGSSGGILYRTDLAEKYNLVDKLENLKSFDDIYPILDVIKKNEPDVEPFYQDHNSYIGNIYTRYDNLIFPAGIYLDGNGEVVNIVESPEYKEMVKKVSQNVKDGYSFKATQEKAENFFVEIIGIKPGKDAELNVNRNYKWKQVELTNRYMSGGDATGSVLTVSRTSENPEKVMEFLELFYTDEYLNNLIVYGIEGENYKKNDDGTISVIENSGYGNAGMQWTFGNTFLNYVVEGDDINKAKLTEEFNATINPSPATGFVVDQEKIKTEVGACQNVRTEFHNRLMGGVDDPEALLAEYIKKLKNAGSDKIMEEVKAQYAEWQKENK